MRGLKAALVARAQVEQLSVSVVVRRAVESELQRFGAARESGNADRAAAPTCPTVKLSIRLTGAEAQLLDAGARRAGRSRGAFLADLIAGIPSLNGAQARRPA